MIRKNDLLLLAVILIVGTGAFVFNTAATQAGEKAKVMAGRDVYGVYALETDREITIDDGDRFNVLVIANGSAKMKEANCANGDCLAQHAINKTGQSIVCLPNQILINIEGADKDELDTVAY